MIDLVLVFAGLALLMGAGDALVRGAVALSLRLGVPALLIGLTVIAFGTSAPELLVSIEAALAGASGIALGNVVGSNIANVLLVLGAPALISTVDGRDCKGGRSYWQMIAASVLFIALCLIGPLGWAHGAALLALLGYVLFDGYRAARAARAGDGCDPLLEELEELEDVDPSMAGWKIAALLAVGLIGLPVGAHLLIDGARALAREAGVSEAAIGLTLVAAGTSLPELATTVAAALRRQADVAIGNVVGSNIFNLAAIMGIASFFGPLDVPGQMLRVDLWIMLGCAAALAPFVLGPFRMTRPVGAALLAAYVAYAWLVLKV
ncbi:calcium/sodium antiporter [Oceanicella actignis]|uniref:calcium/sodium antiporter n=1 Tax=Oceanicella actignis TaxID=1189325 RepID=UPI0011E632D5|nr:calcium/sodium antiporter [Oceanicella actignis]TYO90768.1 cation:H+ antiporter [Oceanicella actignis]